MSWSVDKIDEVHFSFSIGVFMLCKHAHSLRLDCDSSLTFHLKFVQVLRPAAARYRVRELHQSIAKCAFAVINMSYDTQVARALTRNTFQNISGDVPKVSMRRAA
jgi:hypothetical protein